MRLAAKLIVLTAVIGFAATSYAQVNLAGTPTYGTYNFSAGFTPDPQYVAVTAGGTVHTSTLYNCNAGYIASVPDIRVNYNAGSFPLRFYVDTPGTDTTLAVNAPDGTWWCVDDSVGLQPVIDFPYPQSGQYDVFIGTFAQGSYPQVAVYITEMPTVYGPSGGPTAPPTQPSYQYQQQMPTAGINLMANPTYGTYNFTGGFSPDPQYVSATAGGPNDSSTLQTMYGPCRAGFIASAPDIRIFYYPTSYPVRFYVSTPGTDPTLAIRAPDGWWYCNDDTVGLQPVIDFPMPQAGQYDIFIGTFGQGQYPAVTFYITEMPGAYGPTP